MPKPDYGLMDDCEQLYRIRTDCSANILLSHDFYKPPAGFGAAASSAGTDGQFINLSARDVIAIYQKAVDDSWGDGLSRMLFSAQAVLIIDRHISAKT